MTVRCALVGCANSAPGKGGAHSIGYAHGWAIGRVQGLKLATVALTRYPPRADDGAATRIDAGKVELRVLRRFIIVDRWREIDPQR